MKTKIFGQEANSKAYRDKLHRSINKLMLFGVTSLLLAHSVTRLRPSVFI